MKPYDFKVVEEETIKFWNDNNIYEKSKKKGEKGKPFYFLQGPPYTSGKLHMGHAWNNSLKDIVLRYKRMRGFDVWDRAGYDMHGLPTARKVMAKHKLKHKEDIEAFGVDKFINDCISFSQEKADVMTEDLKRLAIWMDYENAYLPIKNEFIEGVWYLVKRAHEQGRLYEGEKTMTWCPSCATAMAKHECEYKEVTDNSIFIKFKVKGKSDENLIIWTTTPWTIMFNLAIMVNPEVDYVKIEVEGEKWIIAKALVGIFMNSVVGKEFKIIEEFKGSTMEGLEYVHPWNDKISFYKELKKKHPKVHTVVLSSEYVDTTAGTGLVHCAPGCGPEDYEVGYRNNIPPFNNIDEEGVFPDDAGEFSGFVARRDDKKFIASMEKEGILIASTLVEHDYAHCERCGSGVIFRKTKQWFFKIEDIKKDMIKMNQEVQWVPKSGQNAFHSWLNNLRDNSITKQRFWGTPVPIWRCEKCDTYEVVGSAEELKTKAGKLPDNLHKPWIDNVTFKCSCGGKMKRLPDIMDVWIDAGSASWICLDYPKRKDLFEKYFPADFILEAKEQVRGWFNLLMISSIIAFGKPSFKSVYMHGMLTDVEGVKMSKSIGNVISPYELIDKHGADTLRYYMCETKPGQDVNFSWDEAKLKHRNLQVLWNVQNFLIDLANTNNIKPKPIDVSKVGFEEGYILSRLQNTITLVTEKQEAYLLNEITPLIEGLYLDLSRDYIKFVRDKKDKQMVVDTIYECLLNILKLMAPNMPFISEAIYQNLKKAFGSDCESVHLCDWPTANNSLINPTREEEVRVAKEVISIILSKREEEGIGVRWPLARVEVHIDNPNVMKVTEGLVLQQTNIKKLLVNKGDLKVEIDTVLTPSLKQEGYMREIARKMQSLRRKAGLNRNDRITATIEADFILEEKFLNELKEKVGADEIVFVKEGAKETKNMLVAKIKGQEFKFVIN